MINNVTLTGRLTRDVEVTKTQSGISLMRNSIAVERSFKNASGERETDFINIIAWRKTAETMGEYLKKGSLIGITGNIQTGRYDHKDGHTVYTTDVVVNEFTFLESRNDSQQNQQSQPKQQAKQENPFANVSDPFETNDTEIDDDSLPF